MQQSLILNAVACLPRPRRIPSITVCTQSPLCAYKVLLKELRGILNEACELNKSAAMEGVVQDDTQSRRKSIAEVQSLIGLNKDLEKMYRKKSDGGDMLSSLMSMEEYDWVNSSSKNSIRSVVSEVADTHMMSKLSSIDNEVQQRYFRRRSTSCGLGMDKRRSHI